MRGACHIVPYPNIALAGMHELDTLSCLCTMRFKGPQCLSSKLDVGMPEASHVLCSRDWEDVSHLLADIGLILEYADLLSGRTVPETSCALLETQLCLPHVAHLARMHLPFVCGKGWASLASRVSTLHIAVFTT